MITEAYPLQWPAGWQRAEKPAPSRFGTWNKKPTIAVAVDEIQLQLARFGAGDIIISTNIKYKADGMPYSRQKEPTDQGVAVYFTKDDQQLVIACDTFDRIGCNLWAIAKSVDAIRAIERWGCSEIVTKAFTGFVALQDGKEKPWWEVLGVASTATSFEVKVAFRVLSKRYHPDYNNGDDSHFKVLQLANEKAKNHFHNL